MRRRHIVIITIIAVPICLIIGAIAFLRSAYLLEKIRATLETQLGQRLERPLLFTTADADLHAEALDNGALPEALRTEFADYGIEFSSAVSVIFHDELREWIVSDENHKWRYAIRREDNSLNVFRYIVSIGDLSGDIFTGLSLKQFEISDEHPRGGRSAARRSLSHSLSTHLIVDRPLISAEEILLKYNLWRLIGGKFYVTKLRFMQPEFNLRMRGDGQLNLTSLAPLIAPASDTELPFQFGIAKLEFFHGQLNYEDSERSLKIAASGIQSRVEGPLDRLEHSGRLLIQDGSVELNDVETKINEFETRFELLSDESEIKQMRLVTGNSRLTIAGKVRDFTKASRYLETKIDLDIDFRDFRNLLPDQFEIAGNAQLNLKAKGTSSDIAGNMHLVLGAVAFNKFRLEELALDAEFNRKALKLTEVNGTLASGKLTAGLEATFGSLAN